MKKIRGLCLPVMLGAVLMSQHVHAADNLTFKGKLIIPACTVLYKMLKLTGVILKFRIWYRVAEIRKTLPST